MTFKIILPPREESDENYESITFVPSAIWERKAVRGPQLYSAVRNNTRYNPVFSESLEIIEFSSEHIFSSWAVLTGLTLSAGRRILNVLWQLKWRRYVQAEEWRLPLPLQHCSTAVGVGYNAVTNLRRIISVFWPFSDNGEERRGQLSRPAAALFLSVSVCERTANIQILYRNETLSITSSTSK